MPKIDSSAISHAEYSSLTQRLTLTFTSGNTYFYDGFPQKLYDAFLRSTSKGRFYNDYIKDKYAALL
jgi:KTSC domain